MGDEAIGPVTVAMMVIGALLFLWPSLRPWIQELRARAQTGSAQRAVLRDLQALGKVRLREAENDGAEVAAALLDAASHPKAEMQGIKVTKSVNASEEKASPRKPSFATRFSLAEKANIANVVQEGSIAVLSERDSKDRHRNDDNDSSGRTNSFHATSLTQHNTIPTNSGAVTKTVGSGEGFVDCDLGGDRDDTYIFLSYVQPALERVLASIRNLDPLTKVSRSHWRTFLCGFQQSLCKNAFRLKFQHLNATGANSILLGDWEETPLWFKRGLDMSFIFFFILFSFRYR